MAGGDRPMVRPLCRLRAMRRDCCVGLISPAPPPSGPLALTDTGRAAYHPALSARVASLGIPVFACTPDQFPDLMATALRRGDISGWAAEQDIKLIRADA